MDDLSCLKMTIGAYWVSLKGRVCYSESVRTEDKILQRERRKKSMKKLLLLLLLTSITITGCGQEKKDNKTTSNSISQEKTEQDSSSHFTLPKTKAQESELSSWYNAEQIEEKCDFKSTEINFDKVIEYKGVEDQSLQKGYEGIQKISLKSPELTEDEVQKVAEYYFRKQIENKENVVQWDVQVESKGKLKYHYLLRFSNQNRTNVVFRYKAKGKKINEREYIKIEKEKQSNKEKTDWQNARYCYDVKDNKAETWLHPQLGKKVKGIIQQNQLILLDGIEKEDIAKLAIATSQEYVDNEIKEDEDMASAFLGIRLSIVKNGKEIAKDITFIWDKNKAYMEPVDLKSDSKIVTVEELAKQISGQE